MWNTLRQNPLRSGANAGEGKKHRFLHKIFVNSSIFCFISPVFLAFCKSLYLKWEVNEGATGVLSPRGLRSTAAAAAAAGILDLHVLQTSQYELVLTGALKSCCWTWCGNTTSNTWCVLIVITCLDSPVVQEVFRSLTYVNVIILNCKNTPL